MEKTKTTQKSHPFETIVSEQGTGKYTLDISSGGHKLVADEPVSMGGDDMGPSPYDLLLSALGSCTVITLRMYANMKKMELDNVIVSLTHKKVHMEDCEACDGGEGMVDMFNRTIKFEGNLSDSDKKKLLKIADKCPVHRTLSGQVQIKTQLEQ